MASLEELIDSIDLPLPVRDAEGNGEDLAVWARRIAYIGALAGKQHALTHSTPVIIKVPVPTLPPEPAVPTEPVEMGEPVVEDLPVEQGDA
jgi:hypothetical protein